jgi:hypothetical protein
MTRPELYTSWRKCLNAFEKSGLNARQFCQKKNLKYPKFLRWKKKLSEPLLAGPLFEELVLSGEISLSAGSLKIEVSKEIDSTSLSQVIRALCTAAGQ